MCRTGGEPVHDLGKPTTARIPMARAAAPARERLGLPMGFPKARTAGKRCALVRNPMPIPCITRVAHLPRQTADWTRLRGYVMPRPAGSGRRAAMQFFMGWLTWAC